MKTGIRIAVVCAVALAVLSGGAAQAQSAAESRLRDQLRQTTLELRQAQDDNTALKLKLESQAPPPAAAPAPAPQPADATRLRRLEAQAGADSAKRAELQQQLDEAHKTLAQWQQSQAQAIALARARDAEARKFQALYQDSDLHSKSCEQSNGWLVQISDELLQRYKDKGVWSALGDSEPLTGLKRVELEKIAQDYHAHIVDSTVKPSEPPPSSP